ncbi:MAG: hypothetical protein U0835_16515 [Isosphaeraceae bacterium]
MSTRTQIRCDDAVRALTSSARSGVEPLALADHLAACPECAALAERDDRLDHAWALTRPAEPTAEAWDAAWSAVCERLDEAETRRKPAVLPLAAASGRSGGSRLGFYAFSLAQAAAILVAAGLLLSARTGGLGTGGAEHVAQRGVLPNEPNTGVGNVAVRLELDIEPGEDVLIHWDEAGKLNVAQRDAAAASTTVDDNFTLFNAFEALASNETAAQE